MNTQDGWPAAASDANIGWPVVGADGTKPPIPTPPTPPKPARLRLHKVSDCSREIRRLYAEVRAGQLAAAEATKLAFLLITLSNMIVDSDLEASVNALEQRARKK